jgi:hypothetical protein
MLVCRQDHRLTSSTAVRWKDLEGESLIGLAKDNPLRDMVDRVLIGLGVDVEMRYEVRYSTTALSMIAEGLGVSIRGGKTSKSQRIHFAERNERFRKSLKSLETRKGPFRRIVCFQWLDPLFASIALIAPTARCRASAGARSISKYMSKTSRTSACGAISESQTRATSAARAPEAMDSRHCVLLSDRFRRARAMNGASVAGSLMVLAYDRRTQVEAFLSLGWSESGLEL